VTAPKGIGGLPPRRPDQQVSQPEVAVQPGSQTGILRVRIIQVIGGPNSGIFVYSGTPAAGNLIASLVGSTTADTFGNTVNANALSFYGTAGNDMVMGLNGGASFLSFITGAVIEQEASNITSSIVGSGNAEQMVMSFAGPKGTSPGDDWVQIEMSSDNKGNTDGAIGFLNYIDESGGIHVALEWNSGGVQATGSFFGTLAGSVNSITPNTFTLTSPGAAAGGPPSAGGTAAVASSFQTGGAALSYVTAFASTYNVTMTAVSNIRSGLSGWGV
jgi:hypothetical protein